MTKTIRSACDEPIRYRERRHETRWPIAWAIAGGCIIGSAIIFVSANGTNPAIAALMLSLTY